MRRIYRTTNVFILLSASMFCNVCFGSIWFRTNDVNCLSNETLVPARIGEPVSVIFCVESDIQIYRYITIRGNSVSDNWYSNYHNNANMNAEITRNEHKATINITFNHVEKKHINDQFYVTVYQCSGRCVHIDKDNVVIRFQLVEQGSIWLLTNDRNCLSNQTSVPVRIGEPASVIFCVESSSQIYDYFYIRTNNNDNKWNTHLSKPMTAKIILNPLKATINITFSHVEDKHIDIFYVTVYTKLSDGRVNNKDNLLIRFQLVQEGVLTEAVVTTLPTITITDSAADTSKLTADSTVSSSIRSDTAPTTTIEPTPTTTISTKPIPTTTTTTTKPIPTQKASCFSETVTKCPKLWHPISTTTCLDVNLTHPISEEQCLRYGGSLATSIQDENLRSCLKYLLQNSTVRAIQLEMSSRRYSYWDVFKGSTITRPYMYIVACLMENDIFAAPVITSFYVAKWDNSKQAWLRNHSLLTSIPSPVTIPSTDHTLKFTCTASGYPKPTISIRRDGTELDRKKDGTALMKNIDCNDSGVYSCHAENIVDSTQAQKQIQISRNVTMDKFTVRNIRGGGRFTPGDKVTMQCSVSGCPAPEVLIMTDDTNKRMITKSATSYIIYEIKSVQCSDMGTFYCRPELWDGRNIVEKVDLTISQCPVQLCRGEEKSKIMTVATNTPVNFSVCVLSDTQPVWKNKIKTNDISVTFTKKDQTNNLYYLVHIKINTRKDNEFEKTIEIGNNHRSLYYNITLKDNKSPPIEPPPTKPPQTKPPPTKPPPTEPPPIEPPPTKPSLTDNERRQQDNKSTDGTDAKVIALPLVFLIVIVILIITGVVLYRKRAKLNSQAAGATVTNDSGNDDSGQVLYANLKWLERSASQRNRQAERTQENTIANFVENDSPSDLTDQDSGRMVSEEGLVYLSVIHAQSQIKKKPPRTKKKPKEVEQDYQVEYMKLDFAKSGQPMTTDLEDGKTEVQDGDKKIEEKLE